MKPSFTKNPVIADSLAIANDIKRDYSPEIF